MLGCVERITKASVDTREDKHLLRNDETSLERVGVPQGHLSTVHNMARMTACT